MTGTGRGKSHNTVEDLKSQTVEEMRKESLRLAEESREAEAAKAEAEQARAEAERAQAEMEEKNADRKEYEEKMRYVQFLLDAAGNLRKRVQYSEGNTSVVRIVDGKPEKTSDGKTRIININAAVEEINDEHKALEKTKRELVNKWCTVQSGTQPKR